MFYLILNNRSMIGKHLKIYGIHQQVIGSVVSAITSGLSEILKSPHLQPASNCRTGRRIGGLDVKSDVKSGSREGGGASRGAGGGGVKFGDNRR